MTIADHQKLLHCQILGPRPETLGILEKDDVSFHNNTLFEQLWESVETLSGRVSFLKKSQEDWTDPELSYDIYLTSCLGGL